MGQTQSIIVYRNPYEQQLWESGFLPVFILAAVVFVLLTYGFMRIAAWIAGGEWYVNTNSWISWAAMALAAMLTAALFLVFL